jgi:N-acetylmuramoyl-L-alanine amidase
MAHRSLSVVTGTLLAILTGVGCKTNSPTTTSFAYPPPSFEAPRMLASVTPRPVYLAVQQPVYVPPVPARRPVPVAAAPAPKPPALALLGPSTWMPPVAPRPWRWIIIHHSATTTGGAVAFDKEHRAKGWDELGYDFVVGNGTDTGNGQIEVGSRWVKQKIGAHAKTPDNRFNEYGIGICLVGNYDIDHPSAKQLEALDRLVAYLMVTYHIPPDHILGHGQTKSTDCPGKYVSLPFIRQRAAVLAGLGNSGAATASSGDGEMLVNVARAK